MSKLKWKTFFVNAVFIKIIILKVSKNVQENVLNGDADFIIVFHIFQVAEVAPRIFYEKSCS